MIPDNISIDEIQAAISQLNLATEKHHCWQQRLMRGIICHLAPDPADLCDDAHCHCDFGRWLYHCDNSAISETNSFKAIESKHRLMHRLAGQMLQESQQQTYIGIDNYDSFSQTIAQLQSDLSTLQRSLEQRLYNRDPLTGARNRQSLLDDLNNLQSRTQRGHEHSMICLLDIDHFKQINDNFGHSVGDQALVNLTAFISDRLRPYDRLYRYGGEEFLITMQDVDGPQCHSIIERLRIELAEHAIAEADGEPIRLTASFGLSTIDSNITVEQSIERADQALYRAKGTGRNQVLLWQPSD